MKIMCNRIREKIFGIKVLTKVKHKGDEFIGKAILIILALIVGGIFIATMKTQFTSFTTKTGTKMDSFFNQIS
uniref:hypothetical protein n=1 Tax=[Lactobacillus] rogosae TaxID=706562 RepID=UPI00402AA4C2